jgi:hypothetical protein
MKWSWPYSRHYCKSPGRTEENYKKPHSVYKVSGLTFKPNITSKSITGREIKLSFDDLHFRGSMMNIYSTVNIVYKSLFINNQARLMDTQ